MHVCGAAAPRLGRLETCSGAQAARWPGRGLDSGLSTHLQPGPHRHLCPPQGQAVAGQQHSGHMATLPALLASILAATKGTRRLRPSLCPAPSGPSAGVGRGPRSRNRHQGTGEGPHPCQEVPSRRSSPHQQTPNPPETEAPRGTGSEQFSAAASQSHHRTRTRPARLQAGRSPAAPLTT